MTANSKQQTANIVSIALFSAFLAACSSSSGGGNAIRSSLSQVPQQYRNAVSAAKTYELDYDDGSGFTSKLTIDGKAGGTYDFSALPNGQSTLSASQTYKDIPGTTTYSGTALVYQQPYSVVIGTTWTQGAGAEFEPDHLNVFLTGEPLGFQTPFAARQTLINQNAIFDYNGVAFDGKEKGTLKYMMNFGSRIGTGDITGFAHTGKIRLRPNQLANDGFIRGDARLEGVDPFKQDVKYELSFYGPNAEEIAGWVYDEKSDNFLGDNEIMFAGKR